jgi:hypothetical protein
MDYFVLNVSMCFIKLVVHFIHSNHAYLSESTEHTVGRGGVQWVTQCISGIICEPSKLHRMYNSSHNYEF